MKFVLMLLVSSASHADLGLDQLKDSFSLWTKNSGAEFDKAEAMKPTLVPTGKEISHLECKSITTEIVANYKVDPFELRSKGSNNTHPVCGGTISEPKTNFLSAVKGLTNFSLPYVSVLQAVGFNNERTSLEVHNYFLNEKNVIVEIQALYFDVGASKNLKATSITSLDKSGSLYFSYAGKSRGPGPEYKGMDFTAHVMNVDGTGRMIRRRIRDEGASQDKYSVVSFERSDKKDWDSAELMITYRRPYYMYAGVPYDIHSKPTMASSVSTVFKNGKESCASGFIRTASTYQTLPSNQAAYEACQRY